MITTLISLALCAAAFSADRLEPIERDLTVTELHRAYHALWKEKVLARGAMVQFVSVPAGGGREIGISILRSAERGDSKKPRFDLIVKEASSSLWSVVVAKHEGTSRPRKVSVKTCKVRLPESTALAIHRALLAMLEKIDPAPDQLVLDSTREIFLARNSSGQELRGRLPLRELGPNTTRLFEMANLTSRACDEPEEKRIIDFRRIENFAREVVESEGKR